MLRKCMKGVSKVGTKCCPKNPKFNDIKHNITQRLQGFAYLYVMIWIFCQIALFVTLVIFFLFSESNIYMQDADCCDPDEFIYLERQNNDLPLVACSTHACMLYDFVFSGDRDFLDPRPRAPKNGDFSHVFEHNGQQWCCNLAGDPEASCCDKMPYGSACGASMWVAGFAAVCAMTMTQIVLSGFYGFVARRSPLFVTISVPFAALLRLAVFFLMFYFFFGFMFLFIFFWAPMFYCDNHYAFGWWKFGLQYVFYFFQNIVWIWTKGMTKWDGNFDLDSLIGTHTTLAFGCDLFFALLYVCVNKIKDKTGNTYFELQFFKL